MVAGTGTQYLDGLPAGVEQAHTTLPSSPQPGPDEIWLRILQEVSTKNNNAVQGSLIILGNERSGKTSLLSRLTGGERHLLSSILEYNYLQIQADPDASYAYQLGGGGAGSLLGPTDSASLPVWILDGKDDISPLIKFTFPSNLAKCIVMVCASLDQPGNIMPALCRWYRQLDEQIRQHYQPEEIIAAKQAQIRFWQEYVEPIESSLHHSTVTLTDVNSTSTVTVADRGGAGSPLLLPPEKGVLDENCGAALFVVITKSDLFIELSTEQLDKVQYHVRQFCLKHGAALIYTSAKEDLNTQMLHKYIAHRIYGLPFTTPAYIVEKDRIFVPTGWDSEQKLSIVKEALGFGNSEVPMLPQQLNQQQSPFSPAIYKSAEREIEAEEEQAFLIRLASLALDGPSSGGGAGGGNSAGGGAQSPRGGGGSASSKAQDTNNTMLANFFSSLLTKDIQRPQSTHSTKSGGGSPAPSIGSAMSVDAEAHFQKMLSGTKGGGAQPHQRANSMATTRQKGGGDGNEQDGTATVMEEDNNDEFEDAPEGDDESFASSLGSQNVTPRSGGAGGTVTGSSTEQPEQEAAISDI